MLERSPTQGIAFALASIGVTMLVTAAFGDKSDGYETVLQSQLEQPLRLLLFACGAMATIALLLLLGQSLRTGIAMLTLTFVPASLATFMLLAPGLITTLHREAALSSPVRLMLAIAGVTALSATLAHLLGR